MSSRITAGGIEELLKEVETERIGFVEIEKRTIKDQEAFYLYVDSQPKSVKIETSGSSPFLPKLNQALENTGYYLIHAILRHASVENSDRSRKSITGDLYQEVNNNG
jgi:hypothetical protein